MNPRTMNAEELRQRLLSAARQQPADDQVPYAFEKRIMARLIRSKPLDPWMLWNRVLWRFAGPCVALTLLLGNVVEIVVDVITGAGPRVADRDIQDIGSRLCVDKVLRDNVAVCAVANQYPARPIE